MSTVRQWIHPDDDWITLHHEGVWLFTFVMIFVGGVFGMAFKPRREES